MQNEKILISKIFDKIKFSKTRNKITNSEFLNEFQINVIKNELSKIKEKNYIFTGGYETAESKILVAYPEKLDNIYEHVNDILKAIKIELPNEIHGKLSHRDYLGTAMSFGLSRERIGDIIVYQDLAYILVLAENAEYIKNSFEVEKRFRKAKIEIIDINEIKVKEPEFEEFNIMIASNRLDNVICEILNTSRKMAQELIFDEKVFINYVAETKMTKAIKEKDRLIIRGSGKYLIDEFLGKNKRSKEIIRIKKYK